RGARDYVVAGGEIGHRAADLLDHAGPLVPEDRGRRMGIEALDKVQIAMANTAGGGLDQDLVVLGFIDIDLFDRKWLMGSVKNRGFHCCHFLRFVAPAGRAWRPSS